MNYLAYYPLIFVMFFAIFLIVMTIWHCVKHDVVAKQNKERYDSQTNLDKLMNNTYDVTDEFTLVTVLGKYDIKYHPTK